VNELLRPFEWIGDEQGHLSVLDQTVLPGELRRIECRDVATLIDAIRRLAVRGAPAIGVAAAYGVVLGVRGAGDPFRALRESAESLRRARPTAVNLGWALDRMLRVEAAGAPHSLAARLLAEARAIHREDAELCLRIGRAGAPLVASGATVLTHCNAGALATGGSGTALAVLFEAWRSGRRFQVFADETRPLLQGARLTALELCTAGIPVTILVDSAAAGLIARGEVHMVIVGADRIAANGDVANKVGTYGVALAAAAHGVPFYVAAPSSTFDLSLADGSQIPIEERASEEVLNNATPPGVTARNPAFDVTPARLITALITEHGVLREPDAESIKKALHDGRSSGHTTGSPQHDAVHEEARRRLRF
jgi:methylthioribose-1-phosphate isomerase